MPIDMYILETTLDHYKKDLALLNQGKSPADIQAKAYEALKEALKLWKWLAETGYDDTFAYLS